MNPTKTFQHHWQRLTQVNPAVLSWQFVRHVYRRFVADGCRQSAAALTYTSLFAVVPLMTVTFSMFSVIPAFQDVSGQIQDVIFTHFVPASGTEIQNYLQEFSSQARKLTGAGVAILVVTSYLMLVTIEKTFNQIWGVTENRRGLSSFLLYWAVLSLGPLLLGLGMVMSTYLLSMELIVQDIDIGGLLRWLLEFLPWLLTTAAFTLLFAAVPNYYVPINHALLGGVFAALLFEVAKELFSSFVANSSFPLIYGSFAMVPIFLLWLYLSWMIVLLGAEVVRGFATFRPATQGYRFPDFIATLMILWTCWQRQHQGLPLREKQVSALGVRNEHWQRLRNRLIAERILVVTRQGGYVLARDLPSIDLTDLAGLFGSRFTELPDEQGEKALAEMPWYPTLRERLQAIRSATEEQLGHSLASLFQSPTSEPQKESGA